jgi:2,3-bisphosphoglycerate-dependent phosphoglycerate mutase
VDAEVVLVRHADSHRPYAGGPGDHERGLSDLGLAQAAELAPSLAALSPTAVLSSPYLRAVQTVRPAAERAGLPVLPVWELREWDSGLAPRPDWAERFADSWADPDLARPGGESLAALTVRAVAALTGLAREHPGGTVLVGTHGTFVARALLGFGATGLDWTFLRLMPMPAVYRLDFGTGPVGLAGPGL